MERIYREIVFTLVSVLNPLEIPAFVSPQQRERNRPRRLQATENIFYRDDLHMLGRWAAGALLKLIVCKDKAEYEGNTGEGCSAQHVTKWELFKWGERRDSAHL